MSKSKNTYIIDPYDERELARLQVQDNLWNEVIDMLPRQFVLGHYPKAGILDLACGPGGWVLHVAQTYPEFSVVGVDISPQMITYARSQAEVQELTPQFRIADILQPWHFPDCAFDLVNARFLTGLIPVRSWDFILQESRRVLRPGGIIRIIATVHTSTPTSFASQKLAMIIYETIYKAGFTVSPYDLSISPIITQKLKHAGFEQITLDAYMVDSSYGTPMHQHVRENDRMGAVLLKPFLLQTKSISSEEFDRLLEESDRDRDDTNFCAHWYICSISAVKND